MEPQMMWDLFVLFVFLPVAIYVWVTYKRERDQTKLGYRNPDLKLLTCNNPNCDFRGDVKPEIRGSKILGIHSVTSRRGVANLIRRLACQYCT